MTHLDDDQLMAQLRRVAHEVDPPATASRGAARTAFGFARLDDELAQLVEDSATSAAGSRGLDDPRLIAFAASDVRLDVEVTPARPGHRLTGVVDGPVTTLAVETPDATLAVSLDPLGRFRVSGITGGLLRLAMGTTSGRGVCTPWVRLA